MGLSREEDDGIPTTSDRDPIHPTILEKKLSIVLFSVNRAAVVELVSIENALAII